MAFSFSTRSLKNLEGVHPDLVKIVHRALELSEVDFWVYEGVRTLQKQREYYAQHKSKTMDSRHLTGHAVDLYPVGNPIPWEQCPQISQAMHHAAEEMGVNIRWGGDWNQNGSSKDETFYDGPHFELPRVAYP